MQKVKCSKCGYLNPVDELVCGMCGEVFKKEKIQPGGKKVVEAVPPDAAGTPKPAKPPKVAKTEKKDKVKKATKAKEKPKPAPQSETKEEPAALRRDVKPAKQAGPSSMSPEELKTMVEAKIDLALPDFLQSEAVMNVVREAAGKMPIPEGGGGAAISGEELEKKIGEVLAKSAGRKGAPGGLTMEAVELKVNAMLAGMREKLVNFPEGEPPATLTDVKKFLEEQGTRELPAAPVDEGKIAALIEAKVAEARPTAAGGTADPEAVKQQIEDTLGEKLGSNEFALLIMEISRDVITHMPEVRKEGGEGAAAPASDEAITARVNELVPDILAGDDFRDHVAKAVEQVSAMPQLSARDVERMINTRLATMPSGGTVDMEAVKSQVASIVKELAPSGGGGGGVTSQELEKQLAESTEGLRSEIKSLVASELKGQLDTEELTAKLRELAAQVASESAPGAPALDVSAIDDKLTQLRDELDKKTTESLGPIEEKIAGITGAIDEKVSAYWQEKLSSDEIVVKISEVARQIAEGTLEARPALTKEDISRPWDEKFSSEEIMEKIREIAKAAVEEQPSLKKEDISEAWEEKFASEGTMQKIREIASEEAAKAAPEAPSFDISAIDDKLTQLRDELDKKTANSLGPIEEKVAGITGVIDEKVSAYWQEKLSSDEIVAKISEVAKQIAEGTLEARPALTKEDISRPWDEKFSSEETMERISEIAKAAAEKELSERPAVSAEEVETKIGEALKSSIKDILASEELYAKMGELAGSAAQTAIESRQVQLAEGVDNLVTHAIGAALDETFKSDEFSQAVRKLADESAAEALAAQPRLTPDDVREIAGGQFDRWIETYFSSQDFKDKVTESIGSTAMDLLRDARSVILEDAEMRTGEQIQASLNVLKYVDPATLSEELESLQDTTTDKLTELEEKLSTRTDALFSKVDEAMSEIDSKVQQVAAASEQGVGPLKEQIDELGERLNDKLAPLYEQFKELTGEMEKRVPSLENELAAFVRNAAGSAVAMEQKLQTLAGQLTSQSEEFKKKIEKLSSGIEEAHSAEDVKEAFAKRLEEVRSSIDSLITEKLTSYEDKFKDLATKFASITPTDPDSIAQMIADKVGDLPRQVEVFQKRLASLAEESLSKGSSGLAKDEVAKIVEERLSSVEGGLGQKEMAALVVTQVESQLSSLLESEEFKKAVHENVTVGIEGGIDKEQFEQALRAFVKLEIQRVIESTKEMMAKVLQSDTFTEKVRSLVASAAGGGEGGIPALDSPEMGKVVLANVKKALDTKEVNLKIAQKFLEVMSYVKSEVPKLVAAAIKKQTS